MCGKTTGEEGPSQSSFVTGTDPGLGAEGTAVDKAMGGAWVLVQESGGVETVPIHFPQAQL